MITLDELKKLFNLGAHYCEAYKASAKSSEGTILGCNTGDTVYYICYKDQWYDICFNNGIFKALRVYVRVDKAIEAKSLAALKVKMDLL